MKTIPEYRLTLENYGELHVTSDAKDAPGENLVFVYLIKMGEDGKRYTISQGIGRKAQEAYHILETKLYNRIWYTVVRIEEERAKAHNR